MPESKADRERKAELRDGGPDEPLDPAMPEAEHLLVLYIFLIRIFEPLNFSSSHYYHFCLNQLEVFLSLRLTVF